MKSILIFSLLITALMIAEPQYAGAYIGPGAGISALGSVLALIGGIFLAIAGFLWYPIKRLLAKFKQKRSADKKVTPS
jgi:hypothetical protein